MNIPDHLILFDGVCNLCNGLVKFIIRRDRQGKIKFSALQSSFGQSFLENFKPDPIKINTVIYVSERRIFYKSLAILHLLKDLGGIWKLSYGFIIIPAFLRDFIYDLIASTRYRIFGKKDSCMIPTDDVKWRFLTNSPASPTRSPSPRGEGEAQIM